MGLAIAGYPRLINCGSDCVQWLVGAAGATSRPTIRRATGATTRTDGNATIQLLIHARAQIIGSAEDKPTADNVTTPEITADMIIDKTKPKTMGA